MITGTDISRQFLLEHEVYAPLQKPAQFLNHHQIEINLGGSFPFKRFRHGLGYMDTCKGGSILVLASPGDREEFQLHGEFDALHIGIAPVLADRLLETANVKFKSTFNVEDHLLNGLAHRLLGEVEKLPDEGNIYKDSLVVALVIHLASCYAADNKKIFAPKGKLSSNQLKNVIEFTRESVHKNVRLAELASCVHLSEYHFARLFRQTLGISPYKFVLEMKIAYAKSLIKNDKRSFSDIAYMLNFSDQAHFSHVFKKLTGASPRHFSNVC